MYTILAVYLLYGIKTYRLAITLGMILSYSWQITAWIMLGLWVILAVRVVLWAKNKKKAKLSSEVEAMTEVQLSSEAEAMAEMQVDTCLLIFLILAS